MRRLDGTEFGGLLLVGGQRLYNEVLPSSQILEHSAVYGQRFPSGLNLGASLPASRHL